MLRYLVCRDKIPEPLGKCHCLGVLKLKLLGLQGQICQG